MRPTENPYKGRIVASVRPLIAITDYFLMNLHFCEGFQLHAKKKITLTLNVMQS